ncbi:nucleotidyltransferase domain-containing protein [Candidatus Woesearchaeota archaeon]|nr:nucleotidyltransferase domain-containing protein [Candidatus Woesearchaeota archaeon]
MINKDTTIIKYLLNNKTKELNILNISKALKMDYKTAYSIVKRLEKKEIIAIEQFGNSNRLKLINKIHPLIFEAEYERRGELLKNKNIKVMLSYFKNSLKPKCYVLLLFGSYAKKTQNQTSDIDLMFICSDGIEEQFEKEVLAVTGILPLPLHCLVFSDKQFIEMINAKKSNVGQEALKNNVILYDIETYYELI